MATILQARAAGNDEAPIPFRFQSENKKAAAEIDRLVAEAASKGKPVTRVVQLTPVLAAVLLDRNPANRKLSERLVETYSYEIGGGRWVFNGEPIIISDDGLLNDGQHRCEAVVRAGRGIEVIMVVGVSRTSRTTLDQGRARTAGDYLGMDGYTDVNALAAAAGYAWQYQTYGMLNAKSGRATKSEVMQFVADHPALPRSLTLFDNTKKVKHIGGKSVLAFCHFAISQVGRRENVDEFFIALMEGAGLPAGNPILYARSRLLQMSGTRDQNGKAEIIFRAWNLFRRNQGVTRMNLMGGVLPVLEA